MIGAFSVIKRAKLGNGKHRPWLDELMARRPVKVAAIALANKIARIAWALMTRGNALPRAPGTTYAASGLTPRATTTLERAVKG